MSGMVDISSVRMGVKNKAKEIVRNKAVGMAKRQQEYLQQEFKVDLLQSEDRDLANVLEGVQANVKQTGDLNFAIELSVEGLSERERNVLDFYCENAKRRLKA